MADYTGGSEQVLAGRGLLSQSIARHSHWKIFSSLSCEASPACGKAQMFWDILTTPDPDYRSCRGPGSLLADFSFSVLKEVGLLPGVFSDVIGVRTYLISELPVVRADVQPGEGPGVSPGEWQDSDPNNVLTNVVLDIDGEDNTLVPHVNETLDGRAVLPEAGPGLPVGNGHVPALVDGLVNQYSVMSRGPTSEVDHGPVDFLALLAAMVLAVLGGAGRLSGNNPDVNQELEVVAPPSMLDSSAEIILLDLVILSLVASPIDMVWQFRHLTLVSPSSLDLDNFTRQDRLTSLVFLSLTLVSLSQLSSLEKSIGLGDLSVLADVVPLLGDVVHQSGEGDHHPAARDETFPSSYPPALRLMILSRFM